MRCQWSFRSLMRPKYTFKPSYYWQEFDEIKSNPKMKNYFYIFFASTIFLLFCYKTFGLGTDLEYHWHESQVF
jgi:hypothetical protein